MCKSLETKRRSEERHNIRAREGWGLRAGKLILAR